MDLKQRIRRDTQLVSADDEAATLLAWLIEHLFDPDLDATFLARESGASRDVRGRLAAKVGALKAYIHELRMIEAARLMCETDLTVAEVAKRLGYRAVRTFSRVFGQIHGTSPIEMRRQSRTEATPDPVEAAAKALAGLNDDDGSASARRPTPRARAARLRRRIALGLETESDGELRHDQCQVLGGGDDRLHRVATT